jgi:SAM-dependent methyltransferase
MKRLTTGEAKNPAALAQRGSDAIMSVKEVPSHHDFLDPLYVKRWIADVQRYRPERQRLFKAFAAEAANINEQTIAVLEVGCGPGLLAEALLQNRKISRYALLDFSPHMLDLSRDRLNAFQGRTMFFQRDFKKKGWSTGIPAGFDLIVSLQAVHELRHASRIPRLYTELHALMAPGGTLLICDHVNSRSRAGRQSAHFMTVEEHLAAFKNAGFVAPREICAAADLSLMAAEKP